jgi:hypothetical protein
LSADSIERPTKGQPSDRRLNKYLMIRRWYRARQTEKLARERAR